MESDVWKCFYWTTLFVCFVSLLLSMTSLIVTVYCDHCFVLWMYRWDKVPNNNHLIKLPLSLKSHYLVGNWITLIKANLLLFFMKVCKLLRFNILLALNWSSGVTSGSILFRPFAYSFFRVSPLFLLLILHMTQMFSFSIKFRFRRLGKILFGNI